MSTKKQEKALEILVEAGGDMPVGKAMREAGYSAATAKTPQKLTESAAYKKLFPDDKTQEIVDNLHKIATKAQDERLQVEATKVWLERAVPKSDPNVPQAVHFHNHQANQREEYDL